MVRGLFRKPRFSQPIVEGRLLQESRPVQPRHATNITALASNPRPESIYAP
jgi:hypothetical protein